MLKFRILESHKDIFDIMYLSRETNKNIDDLRQETKSEIKDVRAEIKDVRKESSTQIKWVVGLMFTGFMSMTAILLKFLH